MNVETPRAIIKPVVKTEPNEEGLFLMTVPKQYSVTVPSKYRMPTKKANRCRYNATIVDECVKRLQKLIGHKPSETVQREESRVGRFGVDSSQS